LLSNHSSVVPSRKPADGVTRRSTGEIRTLPKPASPSGDSSKCVDYAMPHQNACVLVAPLLRAIW
jgi:hypothetical protein